MESSRKVTLLEIKTDTTKVKLVVIRPLNAVARTASNKVTAEIVCFCTHVIYATNVPVSPDVKFTKLCTTLRNMPCPANATFRSVS